MEFPAFKHTLIILILSHVVSTTSEEPSSPTTTTSTSTITTEYVTTTSTSLAVSERVNAGLPARANAGLVTPALSYPDCSDAATYRNYYKASQYKTLDNDIAWDWTTRRSCNLTHILLPPEPHTCGDCDLELTGGAWYRFPIGSLGQIVGFPDERSCPEVGHCNGYGQISLIPSSVQPGHPSAKYFGILISNNPNIAKETCFVGDLEDPSQMVQAFQCPQFTLFQFPKASWDSLDPNKLCRLAVNDSIVPIPSSICLGDELAVLQGDRKYYSSSEQSILSCSNTRSPSPPKPITWTDQDDQDITSQTTRDTALSSLFTAVYSLNSSASYSSVTCQVDDKSHTFYRVSLETRDVTGRAGKEVTATCNVTFDKFSPENEENLYLIEILDDSEVFYTSLNITTRGDTMKIDKGDRGTYKITLTNVRIKAENWKCGVRDPITEIYTTAPFTVTLKSCDPGKGFATEEATECEICPKNTFSSLSQCQDCSVDEVSGAGASRCFQIVAKDETGLENRELITTCSIILDRFSDKIEDNLYLIKVLEGGDIYYTPTNITDDQMQVVKVGSGTYNVSLVLSDPSVPADVRSKTDNWSCGVRDPITEIYTTAPFTVTIKKSCISGTGFVTTGATECVECPEDTFSNQNRCEECPEGEVSQPGSDQCRKEPSTGAVYYAVAGVGGALLIILALMIAALIWTRRRQENNNIVIANPSNDNGRPTNKNSSV